MLNKPIKIKVSRFDGQISKKNVSEKFIIYLKRSFSKKLKKRYLFNLFHLLNWHVYYLYFLKLLMYRFQLQLHY